MKRLALEVLSLHTPRARLAVFSALTLAIYASRYHWLDHLSLWGALGIKHAPSIGLTRAYWLVLHGHPAAAWHRNPLIYLVLMFGLPMVIYDAFSVIKRRTPQTAQLQTVL